jgi:hypothetical protein
MVAAWKAVKVHAESLVNPSTVGGATVNVEAARPPSLSAGRVLEAGIRS